MFSFVRPLHDDIDTGYSEVGHVSNLYNLSDPIVKEVRVLVSWTSIDSYLFNGESARLIRPRSQFLNS